MLWALASQDTAWFTFLQHQKFGALLDYFAQLPGGGSREGTGYGTAQKNLFENYIYWPASTGEDLANLTAHTRDTIDYWVHATVPTRDRFAPIGDQSRSSMPDLYDYHENLVHEAVALAPTSAQARRGTWWLQHNSVDGVRHSFNLQGDLLPLPGPAEAPTERAYHAIGAGAFFARSGWDTDATWVAIVAGKYDQSHAHHDQGAFTLFKRDWLAVTPNIWSHSGIHLDDEVHNVLRFVRADGTTVAQNASDTVQSTLAVTNAGPTIVATADLSNAYSRSSDEVLGWTRTFEFGGDVLRVRDVCHVAAGVRPVFQVQVPVMPAITLDGSIVAGALRIVPLQPVTATWVQLPRPEFSRGYRIDLTSDALCAFDVELRAQ